MQSTLRVLVSLACLFSAPSWLVAESPKSQLQLSHLDRRDDYVILDRWSETIGHGPKAHRYRVRKVRSRATGETETIRFDGRGRAVDMPQLRAPASGQDKISQRLSDQWKRDPDRKSSGIVWIVDAESRSRSISDAALRVAPIKTSAEVKSNRVKQNAVDRANWAKGKAGTTQLRRNIAAANRIVIDAFVTNAELDAQDVIHKYSQAPAVALRLTRQQALRLAARDDVRFIFADPSTVDELPINAPAILAPSLWSAGITGSGAIVAVVGESGPIATANPNLTATLRNPTSTPSGHATRVAGIIGSVHPIVRGAAFDATLLSASRSGAASASSVDAAADWALLNGAMIINTSQGYDATVNGKLNWSDIYFDYYVHNSRTLFVKSAGNLGNSGFVTSPGRGYNSLAVGNIDDGNSPQWIYDQMSYYSSALNPETGTEKPEIAAYGTYVRSTIPYYPWIHDAWGESGTSYAAPLVAGIAALCINQHPGLADEPQALKAMIMTSGAANNIEGSARLSGIDGAGAALATAAKTGFHVESLTASDFGFGGRYEIDTDIPLVMGEPIRIVMVYSHPPVSESALPVLGSYQRSDLDLEMYVNGILIADSDYGDRNPFEIIDYTPIADGTARIKVRADTWHPSVGILRVGFAYASASTLGTSP